MSSIVSACINTINHILGKRKIDDISIDNTEILETNKIELWKAAVEPTNSKRNKFITVHGNINETILTNEYCKPNNNTVTELSYEVPNGIIIVDLAQDNTVVFSNPIQDMEMAVFKSIPNWITTPIFGDEDQLKNPNFNDDKKIKTKYDISIDIKNKTDWVKMFKTNIKNIVTSCNTDSSTISSPANTAKIRNDTNLICKIIGDSLAKGDITLDEFRVVAAKIRNTDINNAYDISIELVKTIDEYILKEEFGLNDDLYTFKQDHKNFDLQGPNMVIQCSHIYFPGDKIHNKIMEWDHGKDFNVFNMIDTRTLNGNITKHTINNMLYNKAKPNISDGDNEMTEAYYLENSIKEYPSQIINNVKHGGDYPLLEQCEKVNKTNFPNKNDNIGKPFQLKDLIKELTPGEKELPIIIYLNSCSPTIRNKHSILGDHRTQRKRRLVMRNIKKDYEFITRLDSTYWSLKIEADNQEDRKINEYLTKVNIAKNKLYENGRNNFIALRKALIDDDETKLYGERGVHDLPRLHKTIVMMGVEERADWYKNVMGAFFSQLKLQNENDINDVQKEKNKEGMKVLYKQAKRDAFNRAIYVLYKNWKNYVNGREKNKHWPEIEWPYDNSEQYNKTPTWMNTTSYGGRKKKTRKKRKKQRRKKTRRKRKKRRRKKTKKKRRRTRRKR